MNNNKVGYRLQSVLLLALALSGCGGGSAGPATSPAPVSPPVAGVPVPQIAAGTWVVMGSSTATGAGAPAGKGWVDQLQATSASSGAKLANIAVGGSVTYQGLSASTPAVAGRPAPNPAGNIDQALSRKPVLLIVSYPTNDTALGYSADETVNNILAIRSQALSAGVPVIVMSTQPRNLSIAQLAQLKDIDRRLAAGAGACFVDVGTALAGTDGHLAAGYDSGDGVHPSEAGHKLIAEQLNKMIASRTCVTLMN